MSNNPGKAWAIISVLFTVIVVSLWFIILYFCYVLMFKSKAKKISKTARILRIIFLISTIYTIGYYPVFRWKPWIESSISWDIDSLGPIWELFFASQFISLGLLFFVTLESVFKETSYSLSRGTQIMIITIAAIGTIGSMFLAMRSIIFPPDSPILNHISTIASAVLFTMYILTMLCLTILFIQKLVIVYKNKCTAQGVTNIDNQEEHSSNSDSLVASITKLTILFGISVVTSILDMIGVSVQAFTTSEASRFGSHLLGVMDLFTNFVNVILMYKVFNMYYYRCCGRVDDSCKKCWMEMINKQQQRSQRRLAQMIDVNSKSSATATI